MPEWLAVEAAVVCGREFSGALLDRLRREMTEHPELSRCALARRVCEWLDWKAPNGQWREVSCRVALLTLERRGVINLPAPRRRITARPRPAPAIESTPICGSLKAVGEVSLVAVSSEQAELSALWHGLMERYHYLGAGPLVGAQQRYLIGSGRGWLGALAFSASAWRVAARDRWIGWSEQARRANLQRVVCNTRLLILPWVEIPNLASHVLALCARQVPTDWERRYGYRPLLLETFVEAARFTGSCYRAANWQRLGTTQGRGRNDRQGRRRLPVKDVYVYRLSRQCKTQLRTAPALGPAAGRRPPAADWAEEEFGGAQLGDERLRRRLVVVARDFYARPQAHIPQACGSNRAKTKAAYRWLAHRQVTMEAILAPHYEASAQRCAREPVVLAVQDTTSFNYTAHPALDGVGPIGTRAVGGPRGILMHDTMAYTASGLPLGLVDVQVWVRDAHQHGQKHQRRCRPIEAKESSKWLRSFQAAAALQARCAHTTVVSVGDREADIYELFALALSRHEHPKLLVRADAERLVADGQAHLGEYVHQQPVCATQVLHVPRRGERAPRIATLEVRFASVQLRPPRHKRKLGPLRLWAVLAEEVGAPQGVPALQWLLLTTVEVSTPEQALEKLQWYTKRWGIEIYHRTLKSGCRIEERQLATVPRLENCLAIDLVVAWRLVHLTMLGRETPAAPCTLFFDDHEWKALYAFVGRALAAVPPTPPTIRDAMRTVASLGGFLGRKGDGEPGVKSLWLGLQRLDDISGAWLMFGPGSPLQPNHPLATSPVSRNPRYG